MLNEMNMHGPHFSFFLVYQNFKISSLFSSEKRISKGLKETFIKSFLLCENAQNFWNRLLLKPDTGKIIIV